MSIGAVEVVFLLLVTLLVLATVVITKGQWAWTVGLAICVGIAVLVTPADILSTFVVATPYAIGYTYLTLRSEQRHVSHCR